MACFAYVSFIAISVIETRLRNVRSFVLPFISSYFGILLISGAIGAMGAVKSLSAKEKYLVCNQQCQSVKIIIILSNYVIIKDVNTASIIRTSDITKIEISLTDIHG